MNICGECGCRCSVISADRGIGPYEYCGVKGNDTDIAFLSDCCEGYVFNSDPLTCNEKELVYTDGQSIICGYCGEITKLAQDDNQQYITNCLCKHSVVFFNSN